MIDLDIKSFFDSIDHDLLMKAVRKHTDCRWAVLYIERWLRAPMQKADGSLVPRDAGTPRGGAISPLLANLFLHYVFVQWMKREHPQVPFERYADDIVCHCQTEREARKLRSALEERLASCRLQLHPQKTQVVYCKDSSRPSAYPVIAFDFLGYTFRPRLVKWPRGTYGVSFQRR